MKVTKRNTFTGKDHTEDLPITAAQMVAYQKGMVAQRAFPNLTADQREFIISGIPPGEFERSLAWPVSAASFTMSTDGITWLSEASALELPPGEWPELVAFKEGTKDVFEKREPIEGEEQGFIYHQINNGPCRLKIYND